MDPIIQRFEAVVPNLQNAVTRLDIERICHKITQISKSHIHVFEKHLADETYYLLNPSAENVVKLLIVKYKDTKDLDLQKFIVCSMLIPGLCMNYLQMRGLFDTYAEENGKLAADCLRTHAWLQNYNFTEKFGVHLPDNLRIVESFNKLGNMSYNNETRFFALATENLLTAYQTKVVQKFSKIVFEVLMKNLENQQKNVRPLLFVLFKHLITCFVQPSLIEVEPSVCEELGNPSNQKNYEENVVSEIMFLPWTNRNKFVLLTHLIAIKPESLLQHSNFHLASFINGIFVGLSMHHLYPQSQSLVKVIQNKDPFRNTLIASVSKFLEESTDDVLVENLVKYWFPSFDAKFLDKVKENFVQDKTVLQTPLTSTKFYRTLMLRNAFKNKFSDEFDERVTKFACDVEDLQTKVQIFVMLTKNVYLEPQLDNILIAFKFIRHHICFKDSSFIDHHIMRKLPELLNLVVLKKFRNLEVQTKIFTIIRDEMYLHGIELGTYESRMFSLKLLNIALKQFRTGDKLRLNKNTDVKENEIFGEYLKDNGIWDLTSANISNSLLKLMNEMENADISELAGEILVEFFIKKSLFTAKEIIEKKLQEKMNSNDLNESRETLKFFVLKFEISVVEQKELQVMKSMLALLKSRFEKLKETGDVPASMLKGEYLFNIIECINYGVRRVNSNETESDLMELTASVVKPIVNFFLDFLHDPAQVMSFEVVDRKLSELSDDDEDLKSKILLTLFYTLRASSILSETLVSMLCATTVSLTHVTSDCVDDNIDILTRSCHKGAIEKASEHLGKITRKVSQAYYNECNKKSSRAKVLHSYLVKLKKEIDCGIKSKGDIRSFRGLLLMAHQIIGNHPPFLKFLMSRLLIVSKTNSIEGVECVQFVEGIKPIQLHLLAALIKDSALLEDMLEHLHHILLATLAAYKESNDFVLLNALLQIISAAVPKMSNQKRHTIESHEKVLISYEPKSVTVEEFALKFPGVIKVALFDLKRNDCSESNNAYIIILLEILSNFEQRGKISVNNNELLRVFEDLMVNRCDKIRILAASCYGQHMEMEKILNDIKQKTLLLFSSDPNLVHSTAFLLRFMIQRYDSCMKYISNFDLPAFKNSLRMKIFNKFKNQSFPASNFFLRCHLLDFFLYLGFLKSHELVLSLQLEEKLQNNFGYKFWINKLKEN